MYKYVSDEIDTDLIFFPSPLPAPSFFGVLVGLAPNLPCVQGRARSFTRSRGFVPLRVFAFRSMDARAYRRTVAQKRWKNERTNERTSGIVGEKRSWTRGVADGIIFGRRANFHSAVNRPRAEAEKLVGNTTKINVCIVTAAGQYPQLHYACYIPCYRRIDNYRPSKRRERKKERKRKRKEVNPG